jgi:hypothetical protein
LNNDVSRVVSLAGATVPIIIIVGMKSDASNRAVLPADITKKMAELAAIAPKFPLWYSECSNYDVNSVDEVFLRSVSALHRYGTTKLSGRERCQLIRLFTFGSKKMAENPSLKK